MYLAHKAIYEACLRMKGSNYPATYQQLMKSMF